MEIKKEPLDFDEKLRKAREVICREFGREIVERENKAVLIQEKIQLTQRYVKILKYVAAYSYYQGDSVKILDSDDPNVETGIHPCVQRLLPSRKDFKPEPSNNSSDIEIKVDTDFFENTEPRYESKDVTISRGGYKIRHCFVVGNVSKWIPPEYREDQSTHKWMMYIRDKKRDDDLGNLIKKVRYFLHESYKPDDIIDVSSSPFHLTRRGWGEFPVRVKIFFTHPDNKPIDIIHHLRLDDTFSGKQMLGGETVVEVELSHDNIEDLVVEGKNESPRKQFKHKNEAIIALEHDYCSNSLNGNNFLSDLKPLFQPQQISSAYGGSHGNTELSVILNWVPQESVSPSEWYRKNVLQRAGSIYFLSSEACVKWFLQRWPIITNLAVNSLYKMFHPYTFPSIDSFARSNVGKQRAAELFRAYKIKEMLKSLNVNPWSTKQIMLYSRMHGYTIFFGNQHFSPASKRFRNFSTCTSQVDASRDLRQLEISSNCEEVDVIGDMDSKKNLSSPMKPQERVTVVSSAIRLLEDTCREIGIKFGDEEIIPGRLTNASLQIMAKTLKMFINDLLRKSFANAWIRNSCKSPSSVEVEDILKAIVENPEFDIFTNAGLGVSNNRV